MKKLGHPEKVSLRKYEILIWDLNEKCFVQMRFQSRMYLSRVEIQFTVFLSITFYFFKFSQLL